MSNPDFYITNHGSLFTLAPISAQANNWCDEHIGPEAMWIGGAVAIEPRYVEPIVEGILEEGMTIQ